jgi:homoserine kinase type II
MLKPHDPTHFERVLRERATHPHAVAQALEPLLAA